MAPRRGKARPRPRLAGLIRAAAARPSAQKPSAHRRKIPNSARTSPAHPAQRSAARHPQLRLNQRFNQPRLGLGRGGPNPWPRLDRFRRTTDRRGLRPDPGRAVAHRPVADRWRRFRFRARLSACASYAGPIRQLEEGPRASALDALITRSICAPATNSRAWHRGLTQWLANWPFRKSERNASAASSAF
jgi:hypothetical protein